MKNKYENIVLSADVVVLHEDEILLIKRKIEPFKGFWVLPGGKVDFGEKVEEAAKREAFEETGIKVEDLKLIGIYSDYDRDPRGHVVSCAYFSKINEKGEVNLNHEASDYEFFKINNLPSDIGYDHSQIISDFIKKFIK